MAGTMLAAIVKTQNNIKATVGYGPIDEVHPDERMNALGALVKLPGEDESNIDFDLCLDDTRDVFVVSRSLQT